MPVCLGRSRYKGKSGMLCVSIQRARAMRTSIYLLSLYCFPDARTIPDKAAEKSLGGFGFKLLIDIKLKQGCTKEESQLRYDQWPGPTADATKSPKQVLSLETFLELTI